MRIHISIFFVFITTIVFSQDAKFSKEILNNPKEHSDSLEAMFNINEIKVFDKNNTKNQVILENGYVKSKIKNPQVWKANQKDVIVTQIDIVFTKYPRDKEDWRTNYHSLLSDRLKELFALDPKLNSNLFEWNLVLQTNCKTEEQTKVFFHGIVIKYVQLSKLENSEELDETSIQTTEYFYRNILKVENFIQSQGGFKDSIILKILERHEEWENSLIVMDWTGSMYPYAAQAVLWHASNFKKSGIKYFTFFNDGDGIEDHRKIMGETGGIYFSKAKNLETLINTFYLVSSKGNGGDSPENDVEALLAAVNRYQDFDDLILIADNNSCVRDFRLLKKLDASVRVILCGTEFGINPQYVNLAYQTGGSLHTIEEDIYDISKRIQNDTITIDRIRYKLNGNDILKNETRLPFAEYNDCGKFTSYLAAGDNAVADFINQEGGIEDSTVYNVLTRHPMWQNSVIVMDWTQGMYTNSAQAVLWQKHNLKKSSVKYYVFFNDGDKKKSREKKIGKTFGIYHVKATNIRKVTKRFKYVQRRGDGGGEIEENDVEALAFASIRTKAKVDNTILIADNKSCVRDIKMAEYLTNPVKIILCDTEESINPQYITLAYKTKGSLHTNAEDVYYYMIKSTVDEGKPLLINGVEYEMDKKGIFQYVDKELSKSQHNCRKFN
ncbi:hypothetical protein ACFLQ5_02015 [Bacteroidota bacterium]